MKANIDNLLAHLHVDILGHCSVLPSKHHLQNKISLNLSA